MKTEEFDNLTFFFSFKPLCKSILNIRISNIISITYISSSPIIEIQNYLCSGFITQLDREMSFLDTVSNTLLPRRTLPFLRPILF